MSATPKAQYTEVRSPVAVPVDPSPVPLIRCGRCNRGVRHWQGSHDAERRVWSITAYCHTETEKFESPEGVAGPVYAFIGKVVP